CRTRASPRLRRLCFTLQALADYFANGVADHREWNLSASNRWIHTEEKLLASKLVGHPDPGPTKGGTFSLSLLGDGIVQGIRLFLDGHRNYSSRIPLYHTAAGVAAASIFACRAWEIFIVPLHFGYF